MQFFKLKPNRTHTIVVAVLLSFVISLPVLSQPLGLATLISQPEPLPQDPVQENIEQQPEVLSAPENITLSGDGVSRSQTDVTEIQQPDETSVPEPTETEPIEVAPVDKKPEFAPVDKTLYVKASQLNMRQEPDLESDILIKIDMGSKVQVTGVYGDWMRIMHDSQVGYIAAEYTSFEMVFVPVEQTRYVNADNLNLRDQHSSDADVVEVLSRDTKVTRIGVGDGWSMVKSASGKTGYVVSEYLTSEVPASVLAAQEAARQAAAQQQAAKAAQVPAVKDGSLAGSASRDQLVSIAHSALGVPYVYAGSSMSGFDCSGFTSWVYRQVGISIPRSTSGYYNAGVGVSRSEMKPGDVICMDARQRGGSSITHVGIYVGNGQMLHASTSRRQIVSVNVNTFFNYGIKLITIRRFVD